MEKSKKNSLLLSCAVSFSAERTHISCAVITDTFFYQAIVPQTITEVKW